MSACVEVLSWSLFPVSLALLGLCRPLFSVYCSHHFHNLSPVQVFLSRSTAIISLPDQPWTCDASEPFPDNFNLHPDRFPFLSDQKLLLDFIFVWLITSLTTPFSPRCSSSVTYKSVTFCDSFTFVLPRHLFWFTQLIPFCGAATFLVTHVGRGC